MLDSNARCLSIEEIEQEAKNFKDDLQREANRCIRRHDSTMALADLEAMEKIDSFVYTLKLRAGSRLHMPRRSRPIRIIKRGS